MRRMPWIARGLVLGVGGVLLAAGPGKVLFSQDFEKVPEGAPPEELQVLNGEFSVKKVEGNACLELAPDPLDSDSVFFGLADKNAYTVSARIWTEASGKRTPEFGVGACGPDSFRLWLMPAVGQLQLLSRSEVLKQAPFKWESGSWVRFRLQVTAREGGKFVVRGKAWKDGGEEPKEWMVSAETTTAPRPGRAGVLATPYSGKVTRFDDLRVEE
jgi:hypothetical protein